MKELFEILGKRISTILVSLGLVTFIIAAAGKIPLPGEDLTIPGYWKISVAIVGVAILLVGIIGAWFESRREPSSGETKKVKCESKPSADRMSPPEKQIIEEFQCEGTLFDTYIADPEKIVDMPRERRWLYELKDVLIKIYKDNRLSLEYKALVKSPHGNFTEVYKSYGSGPFVDGVAHIIYSFNEIDTGSPNWKGSMVLQVPRRGSIVGYWITTNVNRDNKFPMGTINLKRKV
ncbi:MAG: hypothetical protein SV375_07755 [Thermodesulfobacteriota bacterium]|nr:hypothetical protein [Thermodesulfobacteriota bacterium]